MLRSGTVLLPAFLGWLFTYYNSKKTDERKAQIDRINDQVRLLYGPLLACVHASRSAYAAMVRQHSPDGTVHGFVQAVQAHPEGAEGEAYRRWMRVVLQPLNERAADTVVNHVDLLRTPYIDPLLLQLVAHVSANKVILRRWEEGSVREWSAISYPNQASWKGGFSPILSWKAPCAWGPPQQGRGDSSSGPDPNRLLDYVTAEFRRIKRKQSVLLGLPQRALVAGEGDTTAADEDRLEPAPPRPPRARL
ncbi:hypothetical protein CHLNCDRAFT_49364 [Chlorella variabilis]|uniref:Uncharacterized protein n=1 Tax=Chlorella variabilis TaxID=554065 RepID=E1Z234_CHLVA|nr:hypothetical protein CHLNCDRAFT_49364 [Chlorella variabilis]EFN59926.1 hypothetical protein CHLNCDRAFT_49364 [Chlorella variabilis]|eukprot:XP_005852028.1 hypothetical protein CHLNCDRAFT_49364 [Chlorella variabilis]